MKVVINKCFGGFGLSDEAYEWLIEKGMSVSEDEKSDTQILRLKDKDRWIGKFWAPGHDDLEFRSNPLVVAVVEELGELANGACAELEVVEIPYDRCEGWHIDEYDGIEHIAQNHMTWG